MKQEIIPDPLIEWCPTCDKWGFHPRSDHPPVTVVEEDDGTSDDE